MPEGARFVNATSKPRAGAQAAFTMQRLWRQAVWGCIAAAAVLLAVLAAFTDIGSQRAALVFGASNAAPAPHPQTAQTTPSCCTNDDPSPVAFAGRRLCGSAIDADSSRSCR